MPATQYQPGDSIPIVIMGVSGSGKTSVGEGLAERLGLPFRDADEFHPKANIAKMSAGIPLTDADRWPWLDAIGKALAESDGRLIVACSALRRVYRLGWWGATWRGSLLSVLYFVPLVAVCVLLITGIAATAH